MAGSLCGWIKSLPDYRCGRKTRHKQASVILLALLGILAGKMTYRSIRRWAVRNQRSLRLYIELNGGIPSVSTFSRILGKLDPALFEMAFIGWMADVINTNEKHLAVDGKAILAATSRVSGGSTPYVLNAIETETKLVVGVRAIPEKSCEQTQIPELLNTMGISGSIVTIDALGTTPKIAGTILKLGGHFVLQVKKNQPELYKDIMYQFDCLTVEKEEDVGAFEKHYRDAYTKHQTRVKNRDRQEYRMMEAFTEAGEVRDFWKKTSCLGSIGRLTQVRIKKTRSQDGEDTTPDLENFLKNESHGQKAASSGDEADTPVQRIGLISDIPVNAEQLSKYKRDHWLVENSLHYILDETYLEDKSTIRRGMAVMSVIRKIAYNIIRIIAQKTDRMKELFRVIYEEVVGNWEIALEYIFRPVAIS